MARASRLSRRTLLLSCCGWLCAGAARASEIRRLLAGFQRQQVFLRRYRVDATVLFCGLPLFTKRNVGGGYAAVETGFAGKSRAIALQFAAASWPEHCGGLNRFGILHEACVEAPSSESSFAFAGLITASKEEDLDAAKQALQASPDSSLLTLARGVCASGRIEAWTGTIGVPKHSGWMDAASLLESLPDAPEHDVRQSEAGGATPFLTAMRSAGLSHEASSQRPFVHAGKHYVLEVRWREKAALEGVIRNNFGVKSAEFRASYRPGDESGLPLHIEYRAKSFLRLVFEAENNAAQPPVRSLFSEEVI